METLSQFLRQVLADAAFPSEDATEVALVRDSLLSQLILADVVFFHEVSQHLMGCNVRILQVGFVFNFPIVREGGEVVGESSVRFTCCAVAVGNVVHETDDLLVFFFAVGACDATTVHRALSTCFWYAFDDQLRPPRFHLSYSACVKIRLMKMRFWLKLMSTMRRYLLPLMLKMTSSSLPR